MQYSVSSLLVLAALRGVSAAPQATTTEICLSPTATVTFTDRPIECLPVCVKPTSVCFPGEPTGPVPTPPAASTTYELFACTATVKVWDNPGCSHCATCTSAAPALVPRSATSLPGEHRCPTTTTVSTTVEPTAATCNCPASPATCSSGGHLTAAPLPTSTLTEGCTVSVIAGPGDCSNVCSTCAYPTPARVLARATTLPGEQWCPTPTTVSTTVGPQSTEICHCPGALTSCSAGQPTVKPLPTSTLTEGCTASVIAGPGDCSNVCPTCAY